MENRQQKLSRINALEEVTMKRIVIGVLFLCAAFAQSCAGTGNSRRSAYDWMDGRWEGTGYQTDIAETWTVRLEISRQEGSYRIEYPSLGCGGVWIPESVSDTKAVFRERIQHGCDICIASGRAVLTRVDDTHAGFSYFLDDGTLSAFSTLEKRSAAPIPADGDKP